MLSNNEQRNNSLTVWGSSCVSPGLARSCKEPPSFCMTRGGSTLRACCTDALGETTVSTVKCLCRTAGRGEVAGCLLPYLKEDDAEGPADRSAREAHRRCTRSWPVISQSMSTSMYSMAEEESRYPQQGRELPNDKAVTSGLDNTVNHGAKRHQQARSRLH